MYVIVTQWKFKVIVEYTDTVYQRHKYSNEMEKYGVTKK